MPLSFLSFGFLPILYFETTLLSLVWGQKLGLSQAYKTNGSVSEALEEHRSACFSRGLTKVQDKAIWRIVFAIVFASLIYWLFHKEGYVKTRHPRFSTEGGLLFLSVCVIAWHVLLRLQLLAYVRACLSVQRWFQEAKAAAYPRYRSDESRLRSLEEQLENEFESEKLFYTPKSDFFMILLPLFHIVWVPFALQRSLRGVRELIDDEAA